MSDLLQRLRDRGWRLTAQRRVIAEVLDGEHVHFTADEVHALAVERLPEISRASVYNTLGELVALGEVLEVTTDGRAKRYDPNAHHPHQHLVCSGCGLMRDVRITSDPLSALPAEERFGFSVSDVAVTYYGRCPDCVAVVAVAAVTSAGRG
ncbi:Fur family transcriptional regulator [Streptomyces sp. NBC_01803]|uniref:Fur family transcriptional regulator n=1 Tax=Streptomyces sp. NBC_01803 TaxID=2975946 RepID=UPI002DDB3CCA|nr:Fur family transcriptional regulator [Streptomyces sp. NBC_01803]WSA46086.1 transcriptional repressor [Streptomyces sp. NBC_01803]